MEWKLKMMLSMAFLVIIFADIFGYGNAKSESTDQISTDNSITTEEKRPVETKKGRLSDALREACLPKLLCEMAAKPKNSLSDREKDLLSLIKSTTLSLAMAVTPTRWHFAAHMGQLLRYTGDTLFGPTGCSELWPTCPYSSKKLLHLSSKVTLS